MIGSLVVSSLIGMAAHFGEPTVTADTFQMPVKQGIILLVKGKRTITPEGDVMIFAPGLTGESLDRDLTAGPVKHVKIRELPRGLAVVLTPAAEFSPESIVMAEGKIKIEAPAAEVAKPAPVAAKPAQTVAAAAAKPVAPVEQPAIAAPVESAKADTAPAKAPVQFKQESSSSPMRSMLVMAALIAAAAVALVMGKKKKARIKHGPSAGIDLIAVRSLGPKQRLAVIEAGGDRLLIAATDTGVQLLSRLTATQSIPDDAFENVLAEAAASAPSEPVVSPTKGNRRSADVAGLVKLRAARAWNIDAND